MRGAIVLNLGDLARQGEVLMERAREKAEQVVRAAHDERARVLAGAKEQGFAEGRRDGREDGVREGFEHGRAQAIEEFKARLSKLEQSWADALGGFMLQRERLIEGARADVLDVALLSAEKIVKRALAIDPSLVVDQVAAVMEAVARPTESRLAVHPDDEPLVRTAMPAMVQRLEAARHVSLETDASLERGSCVLRTPGAGEIDASIRTQLDRIVETLLPDRATRNPVLTNDAGSKRPEPDGNESAGGAP